MAGYDYDFQLPRYEWEPDYLEDKKLTLDRFDPSPGGTLGAASQLGKAAGGFSLASLIPGLGALGPIGAGVGAIATIASMIASRSAEKEEEERRRKQEALQRAVQISRSFEDAGWGGY